MKKVPGSPFLSRYLNHSLLLASLIILPLAGCALLPRNAVAQSGQPVYQIPERVLTVTGQGIYNIPTTLTQVSLGVEVEAPTAQEAQQQAAAKSTAVVEWVQSQNVDKLETTGISLSPRYDYSNDRQTLRGYQATNTISFRLPTEEASLVIDEAVDAGATRINGVSFVATDEAIAAARQQALEAAVQDAEAQAETVLSALGLARQEVINISIGSVSAPPPSPLAASVVSREQDSTPLIGGEQTLNAQVTLHIRY